MAELRFISSADLFDLLGADEPVQVLDVRTPEEFAHGHIDGSLLIPYDQVREWPDALDPEVPTAVICKAGVRAVHAAAVLDQFTNGVVYVVAQGGVGDWPQLGADLTAG